MRIKELVNGKDAKAWFLRYVATFDKLCQLRQRCGEIATEVLDHRETSYGDTPRTRELMLELADMAKGEE